MSHHIYRQKGTFDKKTFKSIENALQRHGTINSLQEWIKAMLRNRVIYCSISKLFKLPSLITGHCLKKHMNKHMQAMNLIDSPCCRACFTNEETLYHILLNCEEQEYIWIRFLGRGTLYGDRLHAVLSFWKEFCMARLTTIPYAHIGS